MENLEDNIFENFYSSVLSVLTEARKKGIVNRRTQKTPSMTNDVAKLKNSLEKAGQNKITTFSIIDFLFSDSFSQHLVDKENEFK